MSLTTITKAVADRLSENSRFRWSCWAIIAIFWLYGILVLRDEYPKKVDAYQSVLKKIRQLQGAQDKANWPGRLEDARNTRLNLEARLWREGTIGLAQASFQDWLIQAAQQANLSKPTLTGATQEDTGAIEKNNTPNEKPAVSIPADLWKISVILNFEFVPKNFNAFLTQLTAHQKLITIESLVIRGTPAMKAEMILVAYFEKSGNGGPKRVVP